MIELLAGTAVDFSSGLTEFLSFFGTNGILGAWSSVISVILDSANWLMRLPTYVYIGVVAMTSLRSLIKG